MRSAKSPDEYFSETTVWKKELLALRKVLQSTELKEEIKWGGPCYTYNGKNIVGIGGFKSYFGLWFYQGALLKDEAGVLINAQEGRTKALRQWRMGSAKDIRSALVKRYVKEAITLAKAGKEIKPARKKPLAIPPELKAALSKNTRALAAFEKLTPSLRREYAEYIVEAKQATTKERRLEKILPLIAAGRGLNDKYR